MAYNDPGKPFFPSNGTEGMRFESANCDRCYKQRNCSILYVSADKQAAQEKACSSRRRSAGFADMKPIIHTGKPGLCWHCGRKECGLWAATKPVEVSSCSKFKEERKP